MKIGESIWRGIPSEGKCLDTFIITFTKIPIPHVPCGFYKQVMLHTLHETQVKEQDSLLVKQTEKDSRGLRVKGFFRDNRNTSCGEL